MGVMHLAALASRFWPFANGSGRILDKYARGVDLGTGERIAQTSDGFPIHVYADDLIGRHILMSGKFDRSIVQVLLDHAKPGDTLLDIGANIGYVSACFLAKVKGSKSICIDPQPGIVDLLRKNMAQFGDRAEVMQLGLSDREGVLQFHIDKANRGASRIADYGEIELPVMEAAKVLATLPRVNLIKIDVEGHEAPILRSIAKELKRLKPRAILFEDHEGRNNLAKLLPDYRVFGIDKKLMRTRLVPTTTGFNDYLALI